ncbi:hypothetical protein CC1G_03556 [Coprinopsis cinerea okayama7|uniref:F-box domain-containing protein n=1 Tax=Coprinopsis cinerea (strain Okayama-7 / 130 / ATCC MYA-4618 / FGSC 9003) TaxID=240176 RepID=A8NCJ8_COPC7|nr:hypothetical protein CC1G_03556 [Coprinopsis cinerea okayama7\|eukprot:XP_001832542.1 hypothetical protein CC1G_03556 [Coprinopsis cinerea okayama7\
MAKSPSTSRKRQRPVSPPPEASTSASPAEVLTTRRSSPLKKARVEEGASESATLTDGPAAAASTSTQAQQGGVESTAVDVNEEATASANQEPAPEPRRSRRLAASEASSSKVGAPSTPAKRKRAASPADEEATTSKSTDASPSKGKGKEPVKVAPTPAKKRKTAGEPVREQPTSQDEQAARTSRAGKRKRAEESDPPAPEAPAGDQDNKRQKQEQTIEETEQHSESTVAPPAVRGQTPQAPTTIYSVPFEILAEILLYTKSSKAVLSLASTCKHFCHTLLQPEATYVWKYVRENNVPLPPPDYHQYGFGRIFASEASYAKFVFGGGKCEMCGEETEKNFTSYALRIMLCKKPECETRFLNARYLETRDSVVRANQLTSYSQLLPTLEDSQLFNRGGASSHTALLTRKEVPEEVRAFLVEQRDKPDFREKLDRFKVKQMKWMGLCREIIKWRRKVRSTYYEVKERNTELGKAIAERMGWDFEQMMNCTDYGPYHRQKCHVFEEVRLEDVNAVLSTKIQGQLARLLDKIDRRTHEMRYQETRKQIINHYNYLKSSRNKDAIPILPALTAFRTLPVIAMLQDDEASTTPANEVSKSLKNDKVLSNMLRTQITTWVNKARTDLGTQIGLSPLEKRWKSVNKTDLHPVERVNVRYRCKRCTVLGERYEEDGCFDFAGACAHDCSKAGAPPKKKNRGWKWSAENFEKDVKASAAITSFLEKLRPLATTSMFVPLYQLEEKYNGVAGILERLGDSHSVVCTSCPTPIVMKFKNLIGHSHRHDKMEFYISNGIPSTDLVGRYPFQAGYTRHLLKSGQKMKEARDAKVYGCRYCYGKLVEECRVKREAREREREEQGAVQGEELGQSQEQEGQGDANATAGTSAAPQSNVDSDLPKPSVLCSFDGLRSHLKAKHQIEDVRDEDWFLISVPVGLGEAMKRK